MTPTSPPKADGQPADLSGLHWINVDRARDHPDLERRHMLLFFWSPSSVPCLQSLRVLLELLPRYENRLLFVGVHSPRFPREREVETARSAVSRLGLMHPVVHDPQARLRHHHRVDRLPTLVLIRPDGHALRFPGEPDPRRLREVLDHTLAGDAGGAAPAHPVASVLVTSGTTPLPPAGDPARLPQALRFPTAIKAIEGTGAWPRWAVADCGHHQIVLLDDEGRERLRFGSGEGGFADGPADRAMFRFPQGLICSAEAVFVADTGNHCIRRLDIKERRVSTVAGNGQRGLRLPPDPRDGLSTALASPWDLELDGSDLYFSNAGSNQIGVYHCMERTVTLLAGNGRHGTLDGRLRQAQLAQPSSLVIEDSGERLYFADSDSGLVRALTLDEDGHVETVYGPGSGRTSFHGKLQHPLGLAWAENELLIADSYNDRLVAVPLESSGIVEQGNEPWSERLPSLCEPSGVWAEDLERVLIVDTNHHRVVQFRAGDAHCAFWPVAD